MQFISHFTSLIAWQCVKASPSSTEDQVTVCQWLASFILVRAHPTHQTNSDKIHIPVCCAYAVLTVLSARTCPLHCLCRSHTSTHWLTLTISSIISLLTTLSCLLLWTQSTQPRPSLILLPAVRHWLLYNNLRLNPDKSHVMVLGTTQQLHSAAVPASVDIAENLSGHRSGCHWVSPSGFNSAEASYGTVVLLLFYCSAL